MRKLFFLLLVLLLALPVAAAPPESPIIELARYFPEAAPIFAAVRTDDGFVNNLDGVLQQVGKFFPDMLPPGFSLKSLYGQQLAPGVTFGKSIRPWLGSAAAVGLTGSFESLMSARTPPLLIAVEITDRAQAEAFVNQMMDINNTAAFYETAVEGGFTVIAPKARVDEGAFAIGDSVLLIAPEAADLPLTPPERNLAGGEAFNAALDLLPAGGYDLLVYADTPAINRVTLQNFGALGGLGGARGKAMQTVMQFLDAIYAMQGPAAFGMSIIDGLSLTVDFAQLLGDTSKVEALGLTMVYPAAPVDVGFAANVPTDALLVIQGTGIGPSVVNGFENLRALGDYIQQTGLLGDLAAMGSGDARAAEFANSFNLGDLVTFLNLGFAGMTGLNLEKDVLSWMDGDYAMYLRALPSPQLGVTLDGAVVIETSDAAAAQNVVDKLAEAFDQYRVTYSREDNQRRSILALPNVIRALIPPSEREALKSARELDVLLGTNGSVFAMGTRPGVQFSLNPDGGLASDDAFQAAQTYFLPGAQTLFYLHLRPLIPVLANVVPMDADERAALSLIESMSMTGTMSEAGSAARIVLTISDEPPAR